MKLEIEINYKDGIYNFLMQGDINELFRNKDFDIDENGDAVIKQTETDKKWNKVKQRIIDNIVYCLEHPDKDIKAQ